METVTVQNYTPHPQGSSDKSFDKGGDLKHPPKPFLVPAARTEQGGMVEPGTAEVDPEALERWKRHGYVRRLLERGLLRVGRVQVANAGDVAAFAARFPEGSEADAALEQKAAEAEQERAGDKGRRRS